MSEAVVTAMPESSERSSRISTERRRCLGVEWVLQTSKCAGHDTAYLANERDDGPADASIVDVGLNPGMPLECLGGACKECLTALAKRAVVPR